MLLMNLDGSVIWGPTTKPFPATITPITFWVWCYLKCCSVRSVSCCKPDQASPALPPIMDQSDWIIHWPTERLNDPLSHPALIFFPSVDSDHLVDTFACLWCRFFWSFLNGGLNVSQHFACSIIKNQWCTCKIMLWACVTVVKWSFQLLRANCVFVFNHVGKVLLF